MSPLRSSLPKAKISDSGFRIYLVARLISIAGAAATTVVVPVLVFQTTGSAALTGIGGVTYFAFGIPVGHLVDQWPRGPVLVACSVARGLLLLSVPVTAAVGVFRIQYLLVMLVLTNVLFVATDAANAGALRTVVGQDGMQTANATVAGSAAPIEVGAPLAAGAALAITNPPTVFLAEGVALLVSASLLWRIRRRLDTRAIRGRAAVGTWKDAFSGFVFIWADLPVRIATAASLAFALVEGIVTGQLVVFLSASYDREQSAPLLGWSYAGIAAGSLLGSWLLLRVAFPRRPAGVSAIALLSARFFSRHLLPCGHPSPP